MKACWDKARIWEGEDSAFIEYEVGNDTLAPARVQQVSLNQETGATVALEVEDIDEAAKELKSKNIKFLMEKYDGPACTMLLIEDLTEIK